MPSVHQFLANRIASMSTVQAIIGRNSQFAAYMDQYAVRPWKKDADDPYPAVVIAIPSLDFDDDLSGVGRFAKATVEVRCIDYSGAKCWELARAIAYNGGDPHDKNNRAGLHRAKDVEAGLQGSRWVNAQEDEIEDTANADRQIILVECIYEMHLEGGLI